MLGGVHPVFSLCCSSMTLSRVPGPSAAVLNDTDRCDLGVCRFSVLLSGMNVLIVFAACVAMAPFRGVTKAFFLCLAVHVVSGPFGGRWRLDFVFAAAKLPDLDDFLREPRSQETRPCSISSESR